jgi:penicillin-binding protein-related factor A (putative recombinase)
MAANQGKPLENKVSNWLKMSNIYARRLFDARSCGTQDTARQPADFFAYYNRQLFYLECKMTQGNRLGFEQLKQIKVLNSAYIHHVISFFIIQYGDRIIAIETTKLWNFVNNTEERSVHIDMALELGTELQSKEDLFHLLHQHSNQDI